VALGSAVAAGDEPLVVVWVIRVAGRDRM
jgi:hypothetical protein